MLWFHPQTYPIREIQVELPGVEVVVVDVEERHYRLVDPGRPGLLGDETWELDGREMAGGCARGPTISPAWTRSVEVTGPVAWHLDRRDVRRLWRTGSWSPDATDARGLRAATTGCL